MQAQSDNDPVWGLAVLPAPLSGVMVKSTGSLASKGLLSRGACSCTYYGKFSQVPVIAFT